MIRPALDADAPAIAELEALVTPHPWSVRSVRSSLERPITHAWVLELDGVVCGHLITSVLFERAEVLILAVSPTLQRQGWGARLLEHARHQWLEADATEAWLEVRAQNSPARGLYEKLGWVACSVRAAYYTDGSDAVEYRWELTV